MEEHIDVNASDHHQSTPHPQHFAQYYNRIENNYFIRLRYRGALEWVSVAQSHASVIETDIYEEIGNLPDLPGPSKISELDEIRTIPFSDASDLSYLSDISNEVAPRKRAKTELKNRAINVQELKVYILAAPGGKEIVISYRSTKNLDDKNRKRLVNIVVNHMLKDSKDVVPSNGTKAAYASAIVNLFPSLKDTTTDDGYEAFFDPVTKKGFLTNRIRTIFRDRIKPKPETSVATSFDSISEDEEFESHKNFLKYADPIINRIDIFEKTKATFTLRNNSRLRIPEDFPRFLDTDGLISYEFNLVTGKDEDIFTRKFPEFISKLFEVYRTSVSKINETLIKDSDYWTKNTRALLILTELLPPTAPGKNHLMKRETVSSAQQKLIVFQNIQVPLEDILRVKPSPQPFLLAVRTKESEISTFYVVFDQHILRAGDTIIEGFDFLFKCHYVFDIKFYHALEHFFKFMSFFFYEITCDGISSRARELKTKLLL